MESMARDMRHPYIPSTTVLGDTISSLPSSSSAKGPRICASSSVVRPREHEATETAEEREAS